jgi:uncharacterized protein YbjT (DUF2867 family)
MAPIIAVIGSTGRQGGGVVQQLLKSGKYKIRAITRDSSSKRAQELVSLGIEVVTADLNDEASLLQAFEVEVFFPSS